MGSRGQVSHLPRLLSGRSRGFWCPRRLGPRRAPEGPRRADRKVNEVKRKYGDYAAEVARQMADREAAASWGKGSDGESRLASYVRREVGDRVIALHDRLIPGTRGNIDHIFISQA